MSAEANIEALVKVFRTHADTDKAAEMSAYMRSQFAFLGVSAPLRNTLQKSLLLEVTEIDKAFDIAELLWELEEREYQYTACDLLARAISRKTAPVFDPDDLLLRTLQLIKSKSWWDTVDTLAANVAGAIIYRTPRISLLPIASDWIADHNFWAQRSALLLQLKFKSSTNAAVLFDSVLAVAHSDQFFLQKGAGWALREYSKTDPAAVRAFLDDHADTLSALTVREASKYC